MSPVTEPLTEFERNARAVLEASISRIDGRTRSRLNQARQTALAAVGVRHRPWWRSYTLMPAAGVAAALLVAVTLWHREPVAFEPPVFEGQHSANVDDVDLLVDADALDLMEGWDGSFYEWAADQTDGGGQSAG